MDRRHAGSLVEQGRSSNGSSKFRRPLLRRPRSFAALCRSPVCSSDRQLFKHEVLDRWSLHTGTANYKLVRPHGPRIRIGKVALQHGGPVHRLCQPGSPQCAPCRRSQKIEFKAERLRFTLHPTPPPIPARRMARLTALSFPRPCKPRRPSSQTSRPAARAHRPWDFCPPQ